MYFRYASRAREDRTNTHLSLHLETCIISYHNEDVEQTRIVVEIRCEPARLLSLECTRKSIINVNIASLC